MLIVLPRLNEDEVIDEDVVTGAAEFVVVIAEWEFDGACRSPAFESSSESSFGIGCILRSEEELPPPTDEAAAAAEEAEKADAAAAAEKGEAPFAIELLPLPVRMSAMSDWGKNSAATERSVLLTIGWCCPLPTTDCGYDRPDIAAVARV